MDSRILAALHPTIPPSHSPLAFSPPVETTAKPAKDGREKESERVPSAGTHTPLSNELGGGLAWHASPKVSIFRCMVWSLEMSQTGWDRHLYISMSPVVQILGEIRLKTTVTFLALTATTAGHGRQ